jgi:flagellar assembly protein FliH
MPSKILRANSTDEVVPIHWPEMGMPAAPEVPRTPAETRAKAAADDTELRAAFEVRLQSEVARAKAEAYKQGEAAGRKQSAAEIEAVMRKLAQTIQEVAGAKVKLRREAERDVVWLSLAIARRILRRELRIDEEAILGLVKAALENASLREVTEVRTHPSHQTRVQEYLNQLGAPEAIVVRSDATLELGGVVVETDRGQLDASLETQLDEIGRGMADIAEQARRTPR